MADQTSHGSLHNNNKGGLLVKFRGQMKDKDVFSLLSDETFELSNTFDLPYFNEDQKVELEMVASCNGIICLHDKRYEDLSLWNPATKDLKVLPEYRIPSPPGLVLKLSNVGFGFDCKTNDYKVVRINSYMDENGHQKIHQTEIYSLNSDGWKTIDAVIPVSHIMPHARPKAYLNGIYYWWAKYNVNNEIMLLFDGSNEVFQTKPLPNVCRLSTYAEYLKSFAVLNEYIVLILFPRIEVKSFEFWLLKEESWTKLYTIGPISRYALPLGFSKDGKVLLERDAMVQPQNNNSFLKIHVELILCDPVTNQIKNLHVEGEPRSLEVLAYEGTCVSITGANCGIRP